MSIEAVIAAQARPFMLGAKGQALIANELSKGCSASLAPYPVRLEPPFTPLGSSTLSSLRSQSDQFIAEPPSDSADRPRLRVWISPEQPFNWHRCELFIKQLAMVSRRVGFEIAGNSEFIQMTILCHRSDAAVIQTVFRGEFECCWLRPCQSALIDLSGISSEESIAINDFFPHPPYSHPFTVFDELKHSPFETLLCALQGIPAPNVGFYQCLFAPVGNQNNWHRNVEILLDLEYLTRLTSGLGASLTSLQQSPSGELYAFAHAVERKAHNDKPFSVSPSAPG